MITLQNPVPNSPHGLCGRKVTLNWNPAKYHGLCAYRGCLIGFFLKKANPKQAIE